LTTLQKSLFYISIVGTQEKTWPAGHIDTTLSTG